MRGSIGRGPILQHRLSEEKGGNGGSSMSPTIPHPMPGYNNIQACMRQLAAATYRQLECLASVGCAAYEGRIKAFLNNIKTFW
jgi:hypothetical protein